MAQVLICPNMFAGTECEEKTLTEQRPNFFANDKLNRVIYNISYIIWLYNFNGRCLSLKLQRRV